MRKPKKPGELISKMNSRKHKKAMPMYPAGNKPYFPQGNTLGSGYGRMGRNTLQGQSQTIQGTRGSSMPSVPGIMHQKKKPAKHKKRKKNWIAGAIKKPGALHRELGVKQGSKIPAKTLARAAKRGGKLGKRARLAETLKGMHHKKNDHDSDDKMKKRSINRK